MPLDIQQSTVPHPEGVYVMFITMIDSNNGTVNCTWIDENDESQSKWFSYEELGLKENKSLIPLAVQQPTDLRPEKGCVMAVTMIDSNKKAVNCTWIDKNGKPQSKWFSYKELGITEQAEPETQPETDDGISGGPD